MEDINIKSIRYPIAIDDRLEKLALKHGRTKKLIFMQMVDYFYKSKKDPADLNDEVLKKELINGVNRIISFIRTQEKDFLLPTFSDVVKLLTITDTNSKIILGINQYAVRQEQQTGQTLSRISLVEKAITRVHNQLEEKTLLKLRFKKILEYYIIQRESLGWPISAVKKEELQEHVRQSLENL